MKVRIKNSLRKFIYSSINYKHWCLIKSFMKEPRYVFNCLFRQKNKKTDITKKILTEGFYTGDLNKIMGDSSWENTRSELLKLKDSEEERCKSKQTRYVARSKELVDSGFINEFIKESGLAKIAEDYIGGSGYLSVIELWWAWPNFKKSGYPQFHLDRGDFRSLHFFINVIDMPKGSGESLLIDKKKTDEFLSKRKTWGAEMLEDKVISDVIEGYDVQNGSGPSGTILMFDPGHVLHCGGRMTPESERLSLLVSFHSKAKFLKEGFLRPSTNFH